MTLFFNWKGNLVSPPRPVCHPAISYMYFTGRPFAACVSGCTACMYSIDHVLCTACEPGFTTTVYPATIDSTFMDPSACISKPLPLLFGSSFLFFVFLFLFFVYLLLLFFFFPVYYFFCFIVFWFYLIHNTFGFLLGDSCTLLLFILILHLFYHPPYQNYHHCRYEFIVITTIIILRTATCITVIVFNLCNIICLLTVAHEYLSQFALSFPTLSLNVVVCRVPSELRNMRQCYFCYYWEESWDHCLSSGMLLMYRHNHPLSRLQQCTSSV